jgi:transcriptional regulator
MCRLRHGGITRILIIDDDRRSRDPGAWSGASASDGLSRLAAHSAAASGPADRGETVVREFSVPTPVPGTIPSLDLMQEGGSAVPADSQAVRDLIARVQALLADTRARPRDIQRPWPSARMAVGEFVLDLPAQAVERAGRAVRVTQTEFRLLFALVRRQGAVATRDELLREVWDANGAITARVVDTHVARLRRKLEDDPRQPRHILTALAVGYRFRA